MTFKDWIYFLPSSILFASAGVLAYAGKDGWGWMLFVGCIVLPSRSKDNQL